MEQKKDYNTLIGLLLIGAILIWFTLRNKPEEELKDNVPANTEQTEQAPAQQDFQQVEPNTTTDNTQPVVSDSINQIRLNQMYGMFAAGQAGAVAEDLILENEHLKLKFSSKGAQLLSAELKEYQTYDSLPLMLFDEDSSKLNFRFWAAGRTYSSDQLTFEPTVRSEGDTQIIDFRLLANDGAYINVQYRLAKDAYMVQTKILSNGLDEYIVPGSDMNITWDMNLPKQEKSLKNSRANSALYYAYSEDEVEDIGTSSDDEEQAKLVDWVGFKNQFFVVVMDPEGTFERVDLESTTRKGSKKYVKEYSLSADQLIKDASQLIAWDIYFLPAHFNTLAEYDKGFDNMVPLGWAIFRWINRGIVIPTFNLLDDWDWNYGVIILVMALLIKLLLFPLTYKSYMSMAKMRVLKPEIDQITEKHKDPMKKQQATMELYRKAGANPIGGCLPMLLQMPILIAMFRFFPSSFELRQEPFLWASDLSTYDSIWTFGEYPIINTLYGDHVSLFTILMTISTLIYTRMNQQMTMGSGTQMKQMKVMMYLMPIMFLGFFNNYAAGLSYYYFVANLITFGQQWLIRRSVNDDMILAKIEENKKKPKKKSKFQQRLEEAAKQRAQQGRK